LERYRSELNEHEKNILNLKENSRECNSRINGKLDKDEFAKYTENTDIGKIIIEYTKKFVYRSELVKLIRQLEKKIKNLQEGFSREGVHDMGTTNTVFAKKPLGGWSCASCQNSLINIDPTNDHYKSWAKLPKRKTIERIAKVLLLYIRNIN